MSLSAFVRDHHEEIISEFAQFAKTLMPANAEMTEAELRNRAKELLTAAVQDMGIVTSDATSARTRRRPKTLADDG